MIFRTDFPADRPLTVREELQLDLDAALFNHERHGDRSERIAELRAQLEALDDTE